MIYFTPGITQSIWLSLRESVSATQSFKFTLTNDISGKTVSFYPVDLQPENYWSRFEINVDKPQSLPNVVDLSAGMWSLDVSYNSETIETGKILVQEAKDWNKINRPAKNIKVLRR
jgi:hypothetical protein